jgi:glutamate-1-semialdehyde 2,1-aminomutase
VGTVFNPALTDKSGMANRRDMQGTDLALRKRLDFAMFQEGIYNKPTNRYSLSTAHDEDVLEDVLDFRLQACGNALARL